MKRLIALALIIINIFLLSSCAVTEEIVSKIPFFNNSGNVTVDGNIPPEADENETKPDGEAEEVKRTYVDFTPSEKALFNTYIGVVIPFIPNDAYYVEGYYDTDDYEHGINFYTVDNTEDEFKAYLAKFSDYTLTGTDTDEYGDTWYRYVKDDVVVDLSYYEYSDRFYVDVYVYSSLSTDIDDGSDGDGNSGNDGNGAVASSKEAEWRSAYDCITVAEALDICEQVGNSNSAERYYIIATILSITNSQYGEMTIADETGEIYVYGVDSSDGSLDFEDITDKPEVGDVILIYAILKNHNNTLCEVQNGLLIDFYTPESTDSGNTDTGSDNGAVASSKEAEWRSAYDCITVAEALDICEQVGSTKSEDQYYLIATVVEISDTYYGNMTVKDSTGQIYVYGSYGADGENRYGDLSVAVPQAGDVVLFYTKFVTYQGTPEMCSSWIIDFYTPESTDSGNTDTGSDNGGAHTYTDFTADEKALMNERIGLVIPFIPNDDYFVEEYNGEDYGYDGEYGIYFCASGNTVAEFEAYLEKYSSYTYDGTEADGDDTWYYYSKGEVYIDLIHYYYSNDYYLELYAYIITDDTDAGNTGNGSGSNTGSGSATDVDLITNAGAGLPEASGGVFNVDLTKAEKVKDVTDQGYYLDGCPTVGSPKVLVIPVQFSDVSATSKNYTLDAIVSAFCSDDANDGFYSVYEYYLISSYGKLTLDITVLDFWFQPSEDSEYYLEQTYDYYGSSIAIGDQLIMDEALAYIANYTSIDLSDYDTDNNGTIDAIVLINTLDVSSDSDMNWAYRYWNIYADDEGYCYEYDGVSANDYVWASYQFLHESYDEDGNAVYSDTDGINTYTYIHEFAHILGADDYYDTAYVEHPMNGLDMMDAMFGDHNPYTKFNLGWITTSRLVVTEGSITLTLEDFSKNGDTIIIANNWDEALGAYQEYYVLIYYTNNGLNSGDDGYFVRDGVVVYHVNASLYSEVYEGETYYDVYNNNTDPSDDNGTEDNLIEFVKSNLDEYTYIEGSTLPTVTDDLGSELGYTFTVDSLTEDCATITFTAA